ncbi:MAG: transcription repressor NadR [Eubacteriales bacterium]
MTMDNVERREKIAKVIKNSLTPISGNRLSEMFNVSRQIIVQDIALLRAEGLDIIATARGYICTVTKTQGIIRTIAVQHDVNSIEDELKIIIESGGNVIDIIVEHPIYGEIKGNLMIRSMYELDLFLNDFENKKAEPLSTVTNGIHLHTLEVPSQKIFIRIKEELREKKILLY